MSEPDKVVSDAPGPIGGGPSLRTRVTVAVLVAAVVPVVGVAVALAVTGSWESDPLVGRVLLLAIVLAVALGLGIAVYVVSAVTGPMRRIVEAVERTAGGTPAPIAISGEDEIARLAESQNRLAADVERRNREIARIRSAAASATPSAGIEPLLWSAREEVVEAFGLIDAHVLRVEPETVPVEERIPGEPIPIRAELRAGEDRLGLIVGRLPATRTWERTDQDLLELYGVVVGVAMRNADLFARVEEQNRALLAADEVKDDFLRGVSHNLQTPLARIRAYAERISAETGDPRAQVVAEQSERLSRMVRQLLTVTRVDAGTLRPRLEVLALGPRVRRAWEALGAEEVELQLADESAGWLAIADGGQVDQVLWALLDNAVKYGGQYGAVEVSIRADGKAGKLEATIVDHGPGISAADRGRLFQRFARGGHPGAEGTGLGLYLSRQLLRAMGGDLRLERAAKGRGAAFTLTLPGEPPATAP